MECKLFGFQAAQPCTPGAPAYAHNRATKSVCAPGGMSMSRILRLLAWYTRPARCGGSCGLGAMGRQRLATSSTRRTSSSSR